MMLGPRHARTVVSEFLAAVMPVRLTEYRNEWNKSATDLPDPRDYKSWEPIALDAWPTIITVVMSTSNVGVEDYALDEPEYNVVYQMRTYIWARAEGALAVTDMRDDLTTVVRDLLIDNPALRNDYHTNSYDCSFRIDDTTIREEFSDLTLLKGDRIMAGSYIAYDLHGKETINRPAYGYVGFGETSGISLNVDLIDPVPNAPTCVRATTGASQAHISWNAPTWEGGKVPINGYSVQYSTDAGETWLTHTANTGSRATTFTATDLLRGEDHIFRVAGVNIEGSGAYSSSSNSVKPT